MKLQRRWEMAQKYEIDWWSKYSGDIDWYTNFSKEIKREVSPFIEIKKDTYILEIGSGPAGGITYLDSNYKYAIDPLEDYFSTKGKWTKYRDKRVTYCTGKGELLPFKDNFFNLIIIDNVLDHCENPIAVLDEINRVIKSDGIIFFRQNIYNYWGKIMRLIMELVKIDKGHPFTFTKHQMNNNITDRNWVIKKVKDVGFFNTWVNNLNFSTLKGIIQTVFFITRNRTLFILKSK